MTDFQEGQVYILDLLFEMAQSFGLQLDDENTGWWTTRFVPGKHKIYELDACTVTGKTADRAFFPQEIEKCKVDDKVKEVVRNKIYCIVHSLQDMDRELVDVD
jgi:hypothetical protein